jgi:hypothetical protein
MKHDEENGVPAGDRFRNVTVDEDTTIVFRVEARLEPYEVLYEKWVWDGIVGESVIFANDDVANIGDADLESLVRESPIIQPDSAVTIQRSDKGYTFVSFNFDTL